MGATLDLSDYDPNDPDPWLALHLDQSMPIDPEAKAALLRGAASWSRRWMFNIIRPFVFVFFLLVKILRGISPRYPNLNGLLHKTIHWGLKTFATPDANLLIVRHFNIGTELLAFIKANAGDVEINTVPLLPRTLKDLEDNVFLQHDLNVFNFVIQLNASLRKQGRDLSPVDRPDFSMISDEPFEIPRTKKGWLNFVDVQTAVEVYTPLYALMLPRSDFIKLAATRRGGGDLYRQDPGHGLSPVLHQERPPAGAALDHAGRVPADAARARLRSAARLAAADEAPTGRGPANGAAGYGLGAHPGVRRPK
jgi:hypothetical protein